MTRLERNDRETSHKPLSYEKDEKKEDIWWLVVENVNTLILFKCVRENNRGWTLESWAMGSGKTRIFLSRGEWEETEHKKNARTI